MQRFEDFQAAAKALCSVANEAHFPKKDLDRWFSGLRVTSMIEGGLSTSECARRMQVSRQTVYDILAAARNVDLDRIRSFMNEPHPVAAVQMVTGHPKPVFRIAEELGWSQDQTRTHVLTALAGGFVSPVGSEEYAPGTREIYYQTTGKTYVHPEPRTREDRHQRALRAMTIVRRSAPGNLAWLDRPLTRAGYVWALGQLLPRSSEGTPRPPFFTDYLAARDRETRERRPETGDPGVEEKRTDGVALGFGTAGAGEDPEDSMWRFVEEYPQEKASVYPAFVGLDAAARREFEEQDLGRILNRLRGILDRAAAMTGSGHPRNYRVVLTWADVRASRPNGDQEQ